MNNNQQALQIIKVSAQIFQAHKKLWFLSLLGLVPGLLIIVAIAFIFHLDLSFGYNPLKWFSQFQSLLNSIEESSSYSAEMSLDPISPRLWLLIPLYFIFFITDTFFKAIHSHSMVNALNGHPVAIRTSIRRIMQQWKSLIAYALFSSTQGIIRNIINKTGGATINTFSVLTRMRPSHSANNSSEVHQFSQKLYQKIPITVHAGIRQLFILLAMIYVILLILVIIALATIFFFTNDPNIASHMLLVFSIIWSVAVIATFSIVQVYRAALYIYATEDVIPSPYASELFDQ